MIPSRRLGATDLHIMPLVLGGNVFGWTADAATSFAVLDAFVAGADGAGGAMIDTADVYSRWVPGNEGGESETIIGKWLRQSGKRDQVRIATKVGMLAGEGGDKLAPSRIAAACDASLMRLGVDTIDLYFAHQDDDAVAQEDALAAFAKLLDAGKIRALGCSNFSAARLKSANDTARAHALPPYHVLQPEYNLVSRHKFEGEAQNYCVAHNIGVVPYYSLASGYLTGKYRGAADTGKSVRGNHVQPFMDGKGPAILAAMDAVAAETGATLAQIALAWLAAQPGVTAPIASATSVGQVGELLGALTLALSPDQLARLDGAGA